MNSVLLIIFIWLYYRVLIFISTLSKIAVFRNLASPQSRAFRLLLHALYVMRAHINYNTKLSSPSSLKAELTPTDSKMFFLKNYLYSEPEILDPKAYLADWGLGDPKYTDIYLAWCLNTMRYYINSEEEKEHLSFLISFIKKTNAHLEKASVDDKRRIARSLVRYYWGSVNPSIDSDLKDYHVEKMRLLEICGDALEPDLLNLGPFKNVSGALRKIGILRYTYDNSEESIQLRNIFGKLHENSVELVWLIFDSKSDIYCETNEHGENVYHFPQTDLKKTIDFIRKQHVDIAVLTSPTSGKFYHEIALVLQKRVAPAQINVFGNVITTGIKNLDGFAAGDIYDKNKLKNQMTESIWSTHEYGSREHLNFNIQPLTSEWFSKATEITYVSNAHALKISPELLDSWLQILKLSKNTKLVLMPFGTPASFSFRQIFLNNLYSRMKSYAIPKDRIIVKENIEGTKSVQNELKNAHIYLDTFPYSGSTSIFDPITVGIPVVTFEHTYFRGMLGSAMLKHLRLESGITKSKESYIQLAVSLANDKDLLIKFHNETLAARDYVQNQLNKDLERKMYEKLSLAFDEHISHLHRIS